MREPIRLLLADDHAVVRRGIRSLLEQHRDILVVDEASSAEEVLVGVASCQPDVLLIDICLSGPDSPTGIDVAHAHAWVAEHGSLADFPDCERMTNAELLELPNDILVLAALEDQLTAENAPRIDTKLVAEGANGPTDNEADAILVERGIPVLPDVLTNAGGVTVSYFEWVQDLGRLFWTRDEIRARLAEKLGDAFDRVWNLAEQRELTLRNAALVGGIREVAAALEARGIYP
jgi:glutamate dehydrogenase (NAD(P)+)